MFPSNSIQAQYVLKYLTNEYLQQRLPPKCKISSFMSKSDDNTETRNYITGKTFKESLKRQ